PLVLLARPAPPLMSISCYPLHRALHSFPTRRSSDLPQGGAPLPAARHGRRDHHRERPGLRGDRRGLGAAGAAAHDPVLRERAPQDRKSTRLNSSHVSISYAVFCLKKKITNHNTTTQS